MVNFTRAFDSAWERMMVILFRPFDLNKWVVIGFSAFLAGFLGGGNGFNFNNSFNGNANGSTNTSFSFSPGRQQQAISHEVVQWGTNLTSFLHSLQLGIFIVIVALVMVAAIAFTLLVCWLGARGQFLLLDNIVRNRGAVAEPWRRYARPGNGVFFLQVILVAASIVLVLVLLVPVVLLALPLIQNHQHPKGSVLVAFIVLGGAFALAALAADIFFFLFREWGIPLMFRNDLNVRAALGETWRLMTAHPGTATVFILLRIALFVALAVVSLIVCCLTCCVALLPYVGTVVLLPAILFVKCFSLDVLAQLGPDCDVFTVDVPPAPPGAVSLPPPPG